MTQVTVKPTYKQWSDILRANRERVAVLSSVLGTSFCAKIREDVAHEAKAYTSSLREIAKEAKITLCTPSPSHAKGINAPCVMAGHQPVVYHPGLLCKASMVSRLTQDAGGVGVNVVIDTDEGEGGLIAWPRVHNGSLEIKRRSITLDHNAHHGLYYLQRIAPADVVRDVFQEMIRDVRESGLPVQADRLVQFSDAYQSLSGQPVAVANTIVRWMVEEAQYYEVPLTHLIARTPLREVLERLIADGERLVKIYNSTLDSYRQEHKIENAANPFPNLKNTPAGQELPLWCLDEGGRQPVYIPIGDRSRDVGCKRPCPRGGITTLLLRAYCSDLFIHGLGGGRYDVFVDALAKEYLGEELPNFVVASETRHLFPEQVARLSHELELASQLKEMTARTESFLGRGIFSESEERALREVIDNRANLRVAIQAAQAPAERSSIAHELNGANKAIRFIIEQGTLKPILARSAANEAALGLWSFREFPFFLF